VILIVSNSERPSYTDCQFTMLTLSGIDTPPMPQIVSVSLREDPSPAHMRLASNAFTMRRSYINGETRLLWSPISTDECCCK
jgi:hypothetical protein